MSVSTAVIILALIMVMVIIASILQAADKRRRERARKQMQLRQRGALLQDLLIDDSVKVLSPRLRMLVLHKLMDVYRRLAALSPRDPTYPERIDQTRVMLGAIQDQMGNPFEFQLPETKAGLSEAKSSLRTVGKLLNNMIEAKSISPKDSSPLKYDLQNAMLELQVHTHDMAAREAEQEQRYSVAAHNLSTCINLLQRANNSNRLERMDEFHQRLLRAQDQVKMLKESKERERSRRDKDWQDIKQEDGIFLKKHAYDD